MLPALTNIVYFHSTPIGKVSYIFRIHVMLLMVHDVICEHSLPCPALYTNDNGSKTYLNNN